jgi:CHAD domain-containing protein
VAFALQPDEALPQGLARVVLSQLDSAVHHLAALEGDPAEAVHETRKAIKRTRTTLRLLRRALGKATFTQENACLREVSQRLMASREAETLVEVTKRLAKHVAGSPYAEAVAPVHRAFKHRASKQPLSEETLRQVIGSLQELRGRLESRLLDLSRSDIIASLRSGVRRIARRGKRAYEQAYTSPTDDNFHTWRKRVKDLYYASCLLHLSRPNKLGPIIDTLDKLADDLGDEHDLGMLSTVMHDDPQAAGGAVAVALLLQLVARRRAELRHSLRPSGRKLYRQGARRMARSWLKGLQT